MSEDVKFLKMMTVATILVSLLFGILLVAQTSELRKVQSAYDDFISSSMCHKYQMLCTMERNSAVIDEAVKKMDERGK